MTNHLRNHLSETDTRSGDSAEPLNVANAEMLSNIKPVETFPWKIRSRSFYVLFTKLKRFLSGVLPSDVENELPNISVT